MEQEPSASGTAMYHFLVSAVAPRPIAWVTSLHGSSVNVAPFSWFQSVCAAPPILMLSIGDREPPKDTLLNIEQTGQFVVNLVRREHAEQMVATSAAFPRDASEAEVVDVELAPSRKVAPPRIAGAPVSFECVLMETKHLGGAKGATLVFGEVVHIYADDEVLDDRGNVRPDTPLVARLGGHRYLSVKDTFEIRRPQP